MVARMGLLLTALLGADALAAPDRGVDTEVPLEPDARPVPAHRLWYTNATFARVNPLGAISALTLGWRGRLSTKDSVLFKDTYAHAGLSARLSPAFGRLGVHAEVQPLAVLKGWVTYEAVGYFGSFDQIYSVADSSIPYSDQTIEATGATTGATFGTVLTLGGVLQAAAGPVAVRSTFQLVRYDLGLDDGDRFFYDQFWDRLAEDGQFMLLNDLDLLVLAGKARVGARWTWSDTPTAADGTDAALAHNRVGPLFAYQIHDRGAGARFDQPTVFVLAQWWATHPYRTGAEQPGGLPLIAVGFAFRGDLLGERP